MTTTNTEFTNNQPPIKFGDFGGRYAYCSTEVYQFLATQYGVSPAASHRIANQVACDFGHAMKSDKASSEAKHKIGKGTKEGLVTLREALTTSIKGVAQTEALRIAHAVQWLNDSGKHYISYGNTNWKFIPQIDKYILEIEERVKPAAPVETPDSVPVV